MSADPLTVTVKALVDERTAGAIAKVAAREERAVSHVIRTAILADPRIKAVLKGDRNARLLSAQAGTFKAGE